MALTLKQWRTHIDQVVSDEGQWVGLLNEDGAPFLEFPALVSMNAPKTRLAPASVEATVSVADGGRRVLEELVGDGLGRLDAVTRRLAPNDGPTRLLCVVRPGERRVFTVTHSVVEGGVVPSTMTVHGVDLLDGLAWWPCPSIPRVWLKHDVMEWHPGKGGGTYVHKSIPTEFVEWITDASGVPYKTKRRMAQVEMGREADGYTKKGPARTVVRTLIQDSFDAVNRLFGWGVPHAVVDFEQSVDESPEVLIRGDDSSVWDTVSDPALQSGVNVMVDLWWPGDAPVVVRVSEPWAGSVRTAAKTWDVPMQVVRVTY